MNPFEPADCYFPGFPYMESQAPLAGDAVLQGNTVDLIDLMNVRHSTPAFGGAASTRFNVTPSHPDPRHRLHWVLFAIGAANALAPGDLLIQTATVDPTTGLEGAFSYAHHIPYSGPDVMVELVTLSTTAQLTAFSQGEIEINGRYLSAQYKNGPTAQATFLIGLYLRAI